MMTSGHLKGGDPEDYNFGRCQEVTELWWQIYLKETANLADLETLLISEGYWNYDFTDGLDYQVDPGLKIEAYDRSFIIYNLVEF